MKNRAFLNRFESLWRRKRRLEFGESAAAAALLAVCAFAALAVADYEFELGTTTRLVALIAAAAMVALAAILVAWKALRRGTQPRTAADIEKAFPELGQSVRTTVEFGERSPTRIREEGAAESLVEALAERTDERTRPLGMDVVLPLRRFAAIAITGAALGLLVAAAYGFDWEFRTAAQRAALGGSPYRSLFVEPGNVTVDDGNPATISVALVGRTNRDVEFLTRPASHPDAEWTVQTLERVTGAPPTAPAAGSPLNSQEAARPRADFVARFDRLTEGLEYRVRAGDLESEMFRIDIRRPVRIAEMNVELTFPEYTKLSPSEVKDGNLTVLAGTRARIQVTFDKPVKTASVVLAARRVRREPDVEEVPETLPLALVPEASGGGAVRARAEMDLIEDRNYSIVAEAEDGTKLVEKKYRVRVRDDQPPQVSFDSPLDAIEVHTLAELPMRVQVRDDYGLTKAGVVFQINNEQEISLIAEDFEVVAEAARELDATGALSPKLQSVLEQVLPLEHFLLTQKDSVMYFAWAEDNRPGTPQRTESDMRFIDIRPFKREYQVVDPDPMVQMGAGGGLRSLEELIQRQRFGLNRTLNIERRVVSGRLPDPTTLEQLMQFERDLAENIINTAMGLEARGFDDTELFYQAQSAILQAVDSLSVGKWENATLQMRDALKLLIEQRDRSREFLLKNPDAATLAQLRAFDRMQAQKLRRPKTDKEEARELVKRLEALVGQENQIVDSLNSPEASAEPEGDQGSADPESPEPHAPPSDAVSATPDA